MLNRWLKMEIGIILFRTGMNVLPHSTKLKGREKQEEYRGTLQIQHLKLFTELYLLRHKKPMKKFEVSS